MTMQDHWSKKVWTINYAEPTELNDVLLVKNGLSQFRLEPFKDGADVVGYNLTFAEGRMTKAWNPPCRFYRFGNDALPVPGQPPQLPLPPWDSTNEKIRADYYSVATKIQGGCRNSPVWVERLQGEIRVEDRPELVTLYKVKELIQGGKTFLYIEVMAQQAPDIMHIQQSGIAHGNDE